MSNCPAWCRENPCRGEHHPGADSFQDLRVEGGREELQLSVHPAWNELDGEMPKVVLYCNDDTEISMNPGQARQIAEWLLESADKVDIRKMFAEVES